MAKKDDNTGLILFGLAAAGAAIAIFAFRKKEPQCEEGFVYDPVLDACVPEDVSAQILNMEIV